MVKDIEGKEVNAGDEVIMGIRTGCFKAKIAKETVGRIHYYAWNTNSNSYNAHAWYGNKSSNIMSKMYKI